MASRHELSSTPTRMKTGPPSKKELSCFWRQRYCLFSRYDDGVLLDDEAWWSVTPESIAKHIAERILETDGRVLVVDGFCGVGGNLIQFALYSPHVRVIGCDNNLDRLMMAKHNARIYGVHNQCEFILGDFMEVMKSLQGRQIDAVFLSPPWGGIGYRKMKKYSLNTMQPDGFHLVDMCRKYINNNIAFLVPRNTDIAEVSKRLLDSNYPELECEPNAGFNNKIKTITLYFGDLVDPQAELAEETDETQSMSSAVFA